MHKGVVVACGTGVVLVGAAALWLCMQRRKPEGDWLTTLPVNVLKNKLGMEVHISPLGATILNLYVPDAKGETADVVLGFQSIGQYMRGPGTYFGAIVGRVANRIAGAKFKLGNEQYTLFANNGRNSLHGGSLGLHRRIWQPRTFETTAAQGVEYTYNSPHGEEGYPGQLYVSVVYELPKDTNQLKIVITATTDEPTPVNIAQHSYFNLAGHSFGTILQHVVQINADHYTPVDDELIPTGEILPVTGTPFDFTTPHRIGDAIDKVPGGGYDHNYVLFGLGPTASKLVTRGMASTEPKLAATVHEPTSGRALDVLTTAPGMQFYTGNFLAGTSGGKGNATYVKHGGFCMETQGFPNSINQPNFPSVLLDPSDVYKHVLIYRFYNKM